MRTPRLLSALTAVIALGALASCSRAADHRHPRRSGRHHARRRVAARLLPQHHPRPRADRGRQGLLHRRAGQHEAHHPDVQRRRRRDRGAARAAPSTPASSAPARPSTASPSPSGKDVRLIAGSTSGGAQLVVLTGHHDARPAQGQDPRDTAEGQHPGRRAQEVAQAEQPRAGHRGRTRSPCRTSTTRVRSTCSRPRGARGRLAARAVELAAGRRRRQGPRRREERCGRTGSSRAPC